ncbi:nuclear transport factor 2 family protein [Streptomyces lunaelactis]|uniref:nuclear transport factor 2 family protein n=1 Tax=Streptomyces lunaelactis TaxID=1535768 RepID=UPI001585A84D|nr:nuclear transport factor 2 family protein [Streptomyces lunaelactis]NUK06650.1 nuclear transport factor 2 family protein [Streptomyces lunaelactis]NUL10436.1 nuclear transport factor 2 family protein [Streptomyces lunaelactis]NUL21015.1 nuclear transport factor 2 family protein [Streptomyces lunaelactis]
MAEHPDSALIRRGYAAFGTGDMETLGSLMTADVVHHVPGSNPLSGHHKGRDAVLGLYQRLGTETNGTMQVELEAVMADGRGHVMSFHTVRADRGDRGIEIREGLFFTIVGGKITDVDQCTEDIDEEDTFWS